MKRHYFGNLNKQRIENVSAERRLFIVIGFLESLKLGKAADVSQLGAPNIGNPYGVYFDFGTLVQLWILPSTTTQRSSLDSHERTRKTGRFSSSAAGTGAWAHFLTRDNEHLTEMLTSICLRIYGTHSLLSAQCIP